MVKSIIDLKKEYRKVKFIIREPILDIGGGPGNFLASQGIKDAIILDATRDKSSKYSYIYADLTKKIPKISKTFKTIFCMETLEHLKNPLYLLSQIYDLLDDSGTCYISIPYTPIGENSVHISRWTKKEITKQLHKLGFKIKFLETRRRFKNLAFFLPHCWLVIALKKSKIKPSKENIINYDLLMKD